MTRVAGNLAYQLRAPLLPCPCCASVNLLASRYMAAEVEIKCSACSLQINVRLDGTVVDNLAECSRRWNRRELPRNSATLPSDWGEPPNFVNQTLNQPTPFNPRDLLFARTPPTTWAAQRNLPTAPPTPTKEPTPKEIPTTSLTNDEHWFTQIELDEQPNKQARKK